jgi:hypothetical protein
MNRTILTFAWLMVVLSTYHAETAAQCARAIEPHPAPVVSVDFANADLASGLPFDEPFILRGDFPANADTLYLTYGPAVWRSTGSGGSSEINGPGITIEFAKGSTFQSKSFSFRIPAIAPHQPYVFRFHVDQKHTSPGDTITIVSAPKTTLSNRLQTDFGVLRSDNAGYWGVVSDLHIYLMPVNKNESACARRTPLEHVLKRVSLFAGLSPLKIASDEPVASPFTVGTPVVGIGLRQLPYLGAFRVNGGVMFFDQKDANPLVATMRHKRDVFVSVTADIELKNFLGPLASFIK